MPGTAEKVKKYWLGIAFGEDQKPERLAQNALP
jgi:hypothetical protein